MCLYMWYIATLLVSLLFLDQRGDDVMLLAMPQRPRPTRKQSQRQVAGEGQNGDLNQPKMLV